MNLYDLYVSVVCLQSYPKFVVTDSGCLHAQCLTSHPFTFLKALPKDMTFGVCFQKR